MYSISLYEHFDRDFGFFNIRLSKDFVNHANYILTAVSNNTIRNVG